MSRLGKEGKEYVGWVNEFANWFWFLPITDLILGRRHFFRARDGL